MRHSKSGFPLLLTERLKLREPSFSDCGEFHEMLQFPEVTRFSDWPDAPKIAQTERSLKWMCTAYAKGKGCAWAIEDRISGRLLGAIRFNRIDKHSRWAEMGYEIHPSVWGRGMMTEAVNAVTRCGFIDFSLNRIEAWTLPGNVASDRVLEKAGFRYEGTLHQKAWFKNAFHDFRMFACISSESTSTVAY
ncbi:GNAT family N-acetyltransferase [Rhizobium leguminosarum]|uniref:GNAT family N-acetyltransferase n=1 Tax=Rhizobium leguminosarum TaxID=384 RepID=UPI003F95F41B